MENNLLTVAEVAKRLSLSERRVRELADEIGAKVKTSRIILFDPRSVERYAKKPRRPRGRPKKDSKPS